MSDGTRIDGDRVSTSVEKLLGIICAVLVAVIASLWRDQYVDRQNFTKDVADLNIARHVDEEHIQALQSLLALQSKVSDIDKKVSVIDTKLDDALGSTLKVERRGR